MTDQELHDAIFSDPEAKALADVGDDAGAAAIAPLLFPLKVMTKMIDERGVVDAFTDPNEGNDVLDRLDANAATSTLAARVLRWLAPASGGMDIGTINVRAQLDTLEANGVLTAHQVSVLKALAEVPETITANDVSGSGFNTVLTEGYQHHEHYREICAWVTIDPTFNRT